MIINSIKKLISKLKTLFTEEKKVVKKDSIKSIVSEETKVKKPRSTRKKKNEN